MTNHSILDEAVRRVTSIGDRVLWAMMDTNRGFWVDIVIRFDQVLCRAIRKEYHRLLKAHLEYRLLEQST